MKKVTLSDKREIAIDLYKITIKEYEELFIEGITDEKRREVQCKTFGLSVDDFNALPMPDGFALQQAFWDAAKKPLDDPNSESASTSV